MLSSLLLGSGFAFAAAIQPGPLQAYLFSSVAQHGWKRTLPAAFTPILSDGPIILTVLLVLTRLPESGGAHPAGRGRIIAAVFCLVQLP